jgi:fermentation-respiration switch protein FrsA (DUF1100 family)
MGAMGSRAALVTLAVTAAVVLTACSTAGGRSAAQTGPPPTPRSAPPTRTTAAPAAPRTAPAGDFAVGTRTLDLRRGAARPLPTTVWYPEDGDGPFPLILFSHGFTGTPADYAPVLRDWAEAGFVVAAPSYPHTARGVADLDPFDVMNQPDDASYVISRLLERDRTIDPDRIAAAGHSAGGITTIGLFSGDRDDRLIAGAVLAGRLVLPAPFAGSPAPLLFVHGRLDRTVPYAAGLAAFNAVPWPKAMLSVTGAGHVAIASELGPVVATTTDFWRWSLYGDETAQRRLKADATKGGRATWIDRL